MPSSSLKPEQPAQMGDVQLRRAWADQHGDRIAEVSGHGGMNGEAVSYITRHGVPSLRTRSRPHPGPTPMTADERWSRARLRLCPATHPRTNVTAPCPGCARGCTPSPLRLASRALRSPAPSRHAFLSAGSKSRHLDRDSYDSSAPAPMSNPTTTGPILPQPSQSTLYSSYPYGSWAGRSGASSTTPSTSNAPPAARRSSGGCGVGSGPVG